MRSTTDHERSSVGEHQPKHSTNNYGYSNTPVVRRSIESGQYTSHDWLALARENGLVASIGERKSALDNAAMESWFASLKNESIYPAGEPPSRAAARMLLFRYIHVYNTIRMHSTLGYLSPIEYAKLNQQLSV